MIVKQTQRNQKLEKAFEDLDMRYMHRCFDPQTRKLATRFLIDCYREWRNISNASELGEEALKYFWLGAELTDYFNILNEFLETAEGKASSRDDEVETLQTGDVYKWLVLTSQELLKDLSSQLRRRELIKEQDRNMVNHRIRFCSAIAINESYRKSDYDYCREYLHLFIPYMEAQLDHHIEQRKNEREHSGKYVRGDVARRRKDRITEIEEEMISYEDTLSYLYFLRAKSTRQKLFFKEAIDDALRAIDYLLSSAVTLTENENFDRTVSDVKRAHFRLRRVGVTDVVRAWTYLAWGRISAADSVSRRAQLLINKEDGLNYYLARSIGGIVKRVKAGRKDKKQLTESIKLLKDSYAFFNNFPLPRYAVRCLFELAHAYILKNEFGRATELFLDLSNRLRAHSQGTFKNLLAIPRWESQQHLVLSLIAREDRTGEFVKLLADAGWLRHAPTHKRRDLLEIAVEEAEKGLTLARDYKLRLRELEALICCGEAQLAFATELARHQRASVKDKNPEVRDSYDKASVAFNAAVELSFPKGAFAQVGEVILPRQLGAEDCNIEQLALCKLYLAKISIACGEMEQAESNLMYYRSLLPIEQGRVGELAAEVNKEFADLNRCIIVRYKEGDTYRQIKEHYYVALVKKMRVEGRQVKEIAKMLGVSRGTLHKLIDKAKAAEKDKVSTD